MRRAQASVRAERPLASENLERKEASSRGSRAMSGTRLSSATAVLCCPPSRAFPEAVVGQREWQIGVPVIAGEPVRERRRRP